MICASGKKKQHDTVFAKEEEKATRTKSEVNPSLMLPMAPIGLPMISSESGTISPCRIIVWITDLVCMATSLSTSSPVVTVVSGILTSSKRNGMPFRERTCEKNEVV